MKQSSIRKQGFQLHQEDIVISDEDDPENSSINKMPPSWLASTLTSPLTGGNSMMPVKRGIDTANNKQNDFQRSFDIVSYNLSRITSHLNTQVTCKATRQIITNRQIAQQTLSQSTVVSD
jgi:hypothetical protein